MRIGFCGTMSVGKTTLVKALAALPQFSDYFIATERSKYLRDLGIPLNTDSTINGQIIFLAERASELLHANLITDRTPIDVMAFTELATSIRGVHKYKFGELALTLLGQYDYIFYVSPEGVEVEDNGVRTTDKDYRKAIDEKIKSNLWIYNTPHTILEGSNEERIQQVLEKIG
jgi:nicotinamide riboside kinase